MRGVRVVRFVGAVGVEKSDDLAVEDPLAMLVTHGPPRDRRRTTLSVTMRTPGHDRDLAAGLLVAEGVVIDPKDVLGVVPSRNGNAVRVELHPAVVVDLTRLDRRGFTSSSCGVCGKTSLDAVETACDFLSRPGPVISAAVVHALSGRLRDAQPTFARTGGLHAAALFDPMGELLAVREDVGRHNAVDKLIGSEFLAGRLPLADRILFVSGRAGFELIQKAAVAGVAVFAAVGAPSSLAVELAARVGMTLVGFVRDDRFNVYSTPGRIVG